MRTHTDRLPRPGASVLRGWEQSDLKVAPRYSSYRSSNQQLQGSHLNDAGVRRGAIVARDGLGDGGRSIGVALRHF